MPCFASLGIFKCQGCRGNRITADVKKKFLPGFCSIIFNASIAADASIGGNDAEKQYPAPESLCKRENLTTDQELLWVLYHPPLNYLFIQCRSTIMHCGILNIFTKTIMRLIYPPTFYINIVSNFSWVLHSEYWTFSPDNNAPCLPPKFYINIVSSFSWVLHLSWEKLKTIVKQILGVNKVHYGLH